MKKDKLGPSLVQRFSKKQIGVMFVTSLILIALATGYLVFVRSKDTTEVDESYIPGTPRISDGTKEQVLTPQPPPDYNAEIAVLENEIKQRPATYQDYLALAQMCSTVGQIQKAIDYYELAKKVLDPADPNYQSAISTIDVEIKSLKERL